MDMIHKDGYFEGYTSADGKPVYSCCSLVVMLSTPLLDEQHCVIVMCTAEDRGCSVDESRPNRAELQ